MSVKRVNTGRRLGTGITRKNLTVKKTRLDKHKRKKKRQKPTSNTNGKNGH